MNNEQKIKFRDFLYKFSLQVEENTFFSVLEEYLKCKIELGQMLVRLVDELRINLGEVAEFSMELYKILSLPEFINLRDRNEQLTLSNISTKHSESEQVLKSQKFMSPDLSSLISDLSSDLGYDDKSKPKK